MVFQNMFLRRINMVENYTQERQRPEVSLLNDVRELMDNKRRQKDRQFRRTCRIVAKGYALHRRVLEVTGRRTYKTALRRYPEFRQLPEPDQEEHLQEHEYIVRIYENWDLIVENCTKPRMIHLEIRNFPLWKLSKCIGEKFVDKENDRNNPDLRPSRPRPVRRTYELNMVEDIVNNVPGSTDRILDTVNNDPEQVDLISKDFHTYLLQRSNLPPQ